VRWPDAIVTAVAVAAAGVGIGACGLDVELPDLFLITRTGAGSTVVLDVNDGGGITCNGGKQKMMTSAQLITARDLSDDLGTDASRNLTIPAEPGTVYSYKIKMPQGTISFPDRAALGHKYLGQMEAFVLQVSQQYC